MNDLIVAGKIAAARRCVDDMIGFFRRTIVDNSANISKQVRDVTPLPCYYRQLTISSCLLIIIDSKILLISDNVSIVLNLR